MTKNVLETIAGIEIFAIIALIIFFAFFAGVAIWIFRIDKKFIARMENLPLEEK